MAAVTVVVTGHGAARAQGWSQGQAQLGAVVFVPKTGAPLASPMLVKLPGSLAAGQLLNATVVPGSLNPATPTCPLPLTTTVAGTTLGNETVAVTLDAPALTCGGGRYSLTLRLTTQGGPDGAMPRVLADFPVLLHVRFEPSVELRPGSTQPVSLQGITCWFCWPSLPPALTGFLLPQIARGPQTVEVQNTSIGSIRVKPTLDEAGDVSTGLELRSGAPQEILPGGTVRLGIGIKQESTVRAGAHDRRVMLAVAEANVTGEAVERFTSIPVRLNLRIGVSWALFALFVGYLLGRAINLVQDPAFAAKIAFFDRLRMVRFHAIAAGRWDGEGGVKGRVETIAETLEYTTGVPDVLKAQLDAIEANLGSQFAALPLGGQFPPAVPTRSISSVFGWILGGSPPSVRIGADLVRPLAQLAIIAVGLLTGLKLYYLDAPTFGANGILDLMPLVVWAATTMAVAKSLDAFKR